MRAVLAVCLAGVLTQGCAFGRSAKDVTYTPLGVAQKTFPAEFSTVLRAVEEALATLDLPIREVRSAEEDGRKTRAEVVAVTRDRRITVTVTRITATATRTDVDVRKFLSKDTATATAILVQIGENLGS